MKFVVGEIGRNLEKNLPIWSDCIFEIHQESKFELCLKIVLVRRECACVALKREYVGIMQCSFSLVTAEVIAQH